MQNELKALVLAAGFGSRLRPLTDRVPKPLIPFFGSTPLELALWRLKAIGIDDVAINTHHLADPIKALALANPFQQKIFVSHEADLLGTGGVYNPLRDWQQSSDLLVINGDVISDIDLAAVVQAHRYTNALATMALLPDVIPGQSAVHFVTFPNSPVGDVKAIGKHPLANSRPGNFACVQILSRAFVELLPSSGFFDIISQGYQVALSRHMQITAFVHRPASEKGIWHDLGTPLSYWAALQEFLRDPAARAQAGLSECLVYKGRHPQFLRLSTGDFAYCSELSQIDDPSTVGPSSIIEDNCTIAAGASMQHTLVLPGTTIQAGRMCDREIVGQDLRIAL